MTSLTRTAVTAAALGGTLWTVKVVVITARDGSFDPLESVFFIGGLLALLAASVLVPLALSRGLRPLPRAAVVLAGTFALVAVTLALEAIGKALAGAVYSGGNVGIAEESGILLCGVAWLAVAATLAARGGVSVARRRSTTPRAAA